MYPESDTPTYGPCTRVYFSSQKNIIMTQNYSLMQHFVLSNSGMETTCWREFMLLLNHQKSELGYFVVSDGSPYPYENEPEHQVSSIL